jgi:hypothetical protein
MMTLLAVKKEALSASLFIRPNQRLHRSDRSPLQQRMQQLCPMMQEVRGTICRRNIVHRFIWITEELTWPLEMFLFPLKQTANFPIFSAINRTIYQAPSACLN